MDDRVTAEFEIQLKIKVSSWESDALEASSMVLGAIKRAVGTGETLDLGSHVIESCEATLSTREEL